MPDEMTLNDRGLSLPAPTTPSLLVAYEQHCPRMLHLTVRLTDEEVAWIRAIDEWNLTPIETRLREAIHEGLYPLPGWRPGTRPPVNASPPMSHRRNGHG